MAHQVYWKVKLSSFKKKDEGRIERVIIMVMEKNYAKIIYIEDKLSKIIQITYLTKQINANITLGFGRTLTRVR